MTTSYTLEDTKTVPSSEGSPVMYLLESINSMINQLVYLDHFPNGGPTFCDHTFTIRVQFTIQVVQL